MALGRPPDIWKNICLAFAGGPNLSTEADPRNVFVIHGRNADARREVFKFLRAIGLHPIEWSEAVGLTGQGSPYVGDVLDKAFAKAPAIVALLTPDDVVYLDRRLAERDDDPELEVQHQARPNVLYEAGMAMGMKPDSTVIVEFGKLKSFSDIHGRHTVRLNNSQERRLELVNRLKRAGCAVNLEATDWLTDGDLTPPDMESGGSPLGKRVPKSRVGDDPVLDARYMSSGKRGTGTIEISNRGRGDAYDVTVVNLKELGLVVAGEEELPISRLPAGKSVACLHLHSHLGDQRKSYFTMQLSGRTEDGRAIQNEAFVSTGA